MMHSSTYYGYPSKNKHGEDYEQPEFKLTKPHLKNFCLVFENASPQLHKMVTSTVSNNWRDSIDYKKKDGVNPFIQGGYDRTDGWLMIEFWCEEDKASEYVSYLEAKWVGACQAFVLKAMEE